MADPIRVLIVDDSRLFRSALEEALRGVDDVVVVGSVFNGAQALDFIRKTPPDVVTLDVEMPGLNGLATLEQIQRLIAAREVPESLGVVMVSAFTRSGADITVNALQAGAFDFVSKPSGPSEEANLIALRDDVLHKVRSCARRRPRAVVPGVRRVAPAETSELRPGGIRAIAIGASTGGPRAFSDLLPSLCAQVELPILIVQHMPPGFTASLAESLARRTNRRVVEATNGMRVESSHVYIAPGGQHLVVRGARTGVELGLNDQPAENGCRPSADVLFRSAATVFGSALAAIILTGMGRDGTAGLGAVKRAGGYVFAQDEASSVVWGMPGSAVEAGVTNEVLPLDQMAASVAEFIHKNRRS